MSYRNAVDLLTIAARAASARGVSLQEIEDVLERDYRTAQRVIQALGVLYKELESFLTRSRGRSAGGCPVPPLVLCWCRRPTSSPRSGWRRNCWRTAPASIRPRRCGRSTEKILALIPDERSRRIEADEEVLLLALGHAARPGPRAVGQENVDVAISTALKGSSQLSMSYKGWNDEEARDRRVAPHGLLLGARRYLVAIDLEKTDGGIQHFRVDGILSATVLPDTFVRLETFDLDAHAGRCFGSFHESGTVYDVQWRFAPRAAKRAAGFLFHPDQTSEMLPDGSLVVRFSAGGLLEMCWHLYTWGDAVEVVSPLELVEMVAEHRRSDFPSMP